MSIPTSTHRGASSTRVIAIISALVLAVFVAVLYVRWSRGNAVAAQARGAAIVSGVSAPNAQAPVNKVTPDALVRQASMPPTQAASTVAKSEDKPLISPVYTNPDDMKRHDAWLRDIIPQRNPGKQGPIDLDLVMAIVHGKAAWLGRMLDSGISPNTEVQMGYAKESGESLLDFAIESGQIGIAKELVERGAYANQPDNQGMLPLEAAALSGETDLVSFLLDHGADIDKPDISGRNALMGAIVGGSYQTAKLLLNHGASVGAALGKDLVLPPQLAHPRDAQYAAIRDLMVDHGAVMPQGGN